MNRQELKETLKQHELWLSSGGLQGERANLRRANLSGANLSGANLTGARLHYANLIGADLIGSILGTRWMGHAVVDESQLSWLATDPNFPVWVIWLKVEKQ